MEKVQKTKFHINLILGTFLCIIATLFSIFLLANLPFENYSVILGMLCWFLLWFFTHDLAHFLVGTVAGVRFNHYYLGRSDIIKLNIIPNSFKKMPIVLGLKINRKSSRAGKTGFAAMYIAGPLASMLTPFAVPITMLFKDSNNIAGLLLLLISVVNLGFTLWFSPKVGCISKARRVLAANRTKLTL
jgi:hypothetical protein